MKQILQNMSSGETRLVDVPVPKFGKTDVLIQSTSSLCPSRNAYHSDLIA